MAYIIKPGDTLSQLAAANKTDIATLQKLNPQITDINKIFAGQSLDLPTAVLPPTIPVQPQQPAQQPAVKPVIPAVIPPPSAVKQTDIITDPVTGKQYAKGTEYEATYQPYTPQQAEQVLQGKGITIEPTKVQTAPETSWQTTYQDLFKQLGLDTVKNQIDENIKKINDLDNEMIDKIAAVNDNPWLSESMRSLKASRIQEIYESKKSALNSALILSQNTYTQGRQEAQFLVTTALGQYNQQRTFDLNEQKMMADQAEAQAKALKDLSTKNTQVVVKNGRNVLINMQTGETIADLGAAKTTTGEKLLSPAEAKALGVPFGTTEAGAFGKIPIDTTDTMTTAQLQVSIDRVSDDYRQDPVVKQYTTAGPGWSFMSSIKSDTKNPADDIGMIYAFAKIMDPESVVREGEYATVQKYAQQWAASFGFNAARIFSNTKFLTARALDNMKATAKGKFDALKRAHDSAKTTYDQRISDLRAGKTAGGLPDYNFDAPNLDVAITDKEKTMALDKIIGTVETTVNDMSVEKNPQGFFSSLLNMFGLKKK